MPIDNSTIAAAKAATKIAYVKKRVTRARALLASAVADIDALPNNLQNLTVADVIAARKLVDNVTQAELLLRLGLRAFLDLRE